MTITPDQLFEKLKNIKVAAQACQFTYEKCQKIAPIINEINKLKKERNAIILAHSYVSPEIILGVADFVGDSLELSKKALKTTANTILFAAVKFMAETAKLLNPKKEVLIPSELNGCTLADSITPKDVKQKRQEYPNYTFVCYINTTASIKALCDVCVTSSNAFEVINNIPNKNIYFLPDKFMAKNLQNKFQDKKIDKNIKYWHGTCYVHEEYDPDLIIYQRLMHNNLQVYAHPECSPSVTKLADFVGSTSEIITQVKNAPNQYFFLMTECGLSTRLQIENPEKKFIGSCTMCKFMKSNSLENILKTLTNPQKSNIIKIDSTTQKKAVSCLNNMFFYTQKKAPSPIPIYL